MIGVSAIGGGFASFSSFGVAATEVGTKVGVSYSTSSAVSGTPITKFTPTTTANSNCSGMHLVSTNARLALMTDPANGGLRCRFTATFEIAISTASNARFFAGISSVPTSFAANPDAVGSGMGTRMGIGFGDDKVGVLHFITTQTGAANSVVSTGVTATSGHVYFVELFTVPMSDLVIGYLWRQTTHGGAWALMHSYSYATGANLLSLTSGGYSCLGGNGATAAGGLTVSVSSITAQMR